MMPQDRWLGGNILHAREKRTAQSAPTRCLNAFTLIELLIVIGLLGALAVIMLPSFKFRKSSADKAVMESEMTDIQFAFRRFYDDCLPDSNQMAALTNIGLAPLIVRTNASPAFEYPQFDPAKNRGWRGPYAFSETTNIAGGAIPTLLDPYMNPYVVRCDPTNRCYYLENTTNASRPTNLIRRQLTFNGHANPE